MSDTDYLGIIGVNGSFLVLAVGDTADGVFDDMASMLNVDVDKDGAIRFRYGDDGEELAIWQIRGPIVLMVMTEEAWRLLR